MTAKIFNKDVILTAQEYSTLEKMVKQNPAPKGAPKNAFLKMALKRLSENPEILNREGVFGFVDEGMDELLMRHISDLSEKGDYDGMRHASDRGSEILGKDLAGYSAARLIDKIPSLLKEMDIDGLETLYSNSGRIVQGQIQNGVRDYLRELMNERDLLDSGKAVDRFLEVMDKAGKFGLLFEEDRTLEDEDTELGEIKGEHVKGFTSELITYATGVTTSILTGLARLDHEMLSVFADADNRYATLIEHLDKLAFIDNYYDHDDMDNEEGTVQLQTLAVADEVRIAASKLGEGKAIDMLLRTDSIYERFEAGDTARQAIAVQLYDRGLIIEAAHIAGQLDENNVYRGRLLRDVLKGYLETGELRQEIFDDVMKELEIPFSYQEVYKALKDKDLVRAAKMTSIKLDTTLGLISEAEEAQESDEKKSEFKKILRDVNRMRDEVGHIAKVAYRAKTIDQNGLREAMGELDQESEWTIYEVVTGDKITPEELKSGVEPVLRSQDTKMRKDLLEATVDAYDEKLIQYADVMDVYTPLGLAKEASALCSETERTRGKYLEAAKLAMRAGEERQRLTKVLWQDMETASEEEISDDTLIESAKELKNSTRGKKRVTLRAIEDMQTQRALAKSGETPKYQGLIAKVKHAAATGDVGLMDMFFDEVLAGSEYDKTLFPDGILKTGETLSMKERANVEVGRRYMKDGDFVLAAEHFTNAPSSKRQESETLWKQIQMTPVVDYDQRSEDTEVITEGLVLEVGRVLDDTKRAKSILARKATKGFAIAENISSDEDYLTRIATLAIGSENHEIEGELFNSIVLAYKERRADETAVHTIARQFSMEPMARLEVAKIKYERDGDYLSAVEDAKEAGEQGREFIEDVWANENERYDGTDIEHETGLLTLATRLGKEEDETYKKAVSMQMTNAEYERAAELAVASGLEQLRANVKSTITQYCEQDKMTMDRGADILEQLGYLNDAKTARMIAAMDQPEGGVPDYDTVDQAVMGVESPFAERPTDEMEMPGAHEETVLGEQYGSLTAALEGAQSQERANQPSVVVDPMLGSSHSVSGSIGDEGSDMVIYRGPVNPDDGE